MQWQTFAKTFNDARNIAVFIFGMLCGMFSVYGFAPFSCAYFVSLWLLGKKYFIAAIGIALGNLLFSNFLCIPSLIICILLCVVWVLWQKDKIKVLDKLLILAISQMCIIFYHHADFMQCLCVIINTIVSVALCFIVYNCLKTLDIALQTRRLLAPFELARICTIAGIFVLLLSPIKTGAFSVALAVAGGFCMIGSSLSGAYGLCFAVISALGASFASGVFSVDVIATFSTAAVLCSLLREYGKVALAAMFFAVCVGMGVCITKCISLLDCGAAVFIYIVAPSKLMLALNAYTSMAGQNQEENINVKDDIQMLARATCSLSEALSASSLGSDSKLAMRQFGAVSKLLGSMAGGSHKGKAVIGVDTGMACIPKSNCAHTGDSVSVTEVNNKVIVAVSDGMGSGILAHNESSAAVEAFTDMISAGFGINDSVDCANRRLLARCSKDFYATLDAVIIDKCSAKANIIKMGAPPSFIIRDGRARDICGEALPIGIVEKVTPSVRQIKLEAGDRIVILTDGVTDALGSRLIAGITDTAAKINDTREFARTLLDIASENGAVDDMSIVCINIQGK